jgi:hypothetical protein
MVDTVDLDVGVAPDAIAAAADARESVGAVGMALSLGRTETDAVFSVVGKSHSERWSLWEPSCQRNWHG